MALTENGLPREIGVGLISVGWMGKLHTRAYQALASVYPELRLSPRLVHAADTAPDRVDYAKNVLGYERGSSDYRDVSGSWVKVPAVSGASYGGDRLVTSGQGAL